MLSINNLHAKIEDGVEILKGINLEIKPGEVHAIMGQMVQENLLFLL
jgi:Fe-S cluster assembly ATP-binding protein